MMWSCVEDCDDDHPAPSRSVPRSRCVTAPSTSLPRVMGRTIGYAVRRCVWAAAAAGRAMCVSVSLCRCAGCADQHIITANHSANSWVNSWHVSEGIPGKAVCLRGLCCRRDEKENSIPRKVARRFSCIMREIQGKLLAYSKRKMTMNPMAKPGIIRGKFLPILKTLYAALLWQAG